MPVYIFVQVLGDEHPATSTSLNNLAGILMEQNKLAEAEPLMRKALKVSKPFWNEAPGAEGLVSGF